MVQELKNVNAIEAGIQQCVHAFKCSLKMKTSNRYENINTGKTVRYRYKSYIGFRKKFLMKKIKNKNFDEKCFSFFKTF
jgi:hypothetical protein